MSTEGSHRDEALSEALTHLFDPNIRMPEAPRLIDDLDVFDMPDGLGIQFRGGVFPVVIRGTAAAEAFGYVREVMNGRATTSEIVAGAPCPPGSVAVAKLLSVLHSKGLLQQGSAPALEMSDPLGRQILFWGRHLGIAGNAESGMQVQERLATAQVLLVGSGLFGLSVADLLRRTGIESIAIVDASCGRCSPVDWRIAGALPVSISESVESLGRLVDQRVEEADLVICAAAEANHSMLSMVNRICCFAGTRLLLAASSEARLDLGPLVQPGESACFECLVLREQSMSSSAIENMLYQQHLAEESGNATVGESIAVSALYASLVVTEAVRVLTGVAAPTLLNHVTSVEGVRGSLVTNIVPRVPRCPTCTRAATKVTVEDL